VLELVARARDAPAAAAGATYRNRADVPQTSDSDLAAPSCPVCASAPFGISRRQPWNQRGRKMSSPSSSAPSLMKFSALTWYFQMSRSVAFVARS
jgi:hypothetical protein